MGRRLPGRPGVRAVRPTPRRAGRRRCVADPRSEWVVSRRRDGRAPSTSARTGRRRRGGGPASRPTCAPRSPRWCRRGDGRDRGGVLVQATRLDNGDDGRAATVPWVVGALMFLVGVLIGRPGPARHGRVGGRRPRRAPRTGSGWAPGGGAGGLRDRATRGSGTSWPPTRCSRGRRLLGAPPVRGRRLRLAASPPWSSWLRPSASGSRCRPARGGSDGPVGLLLDGFGGALTPTNLLLGAPRRDPRHRRRRAAGDRPGADRRAAAADHLQAGALRRADPVRGHLLRRHVRRLDDRRSCSTPPARAPR